MFLHEQTELSSLVSVFAVVIVVVVVVVVVFIFFITFSTHDYQINLYWVFCIYNLCTCTCPIVSLFEESLWTVQSSCFNCG